MRLPVGIEPGSVVIDNPAARSWPPTPRRIPVVVDLCDPGEQSPPGAALAIVPIVPIVLAIVPIVLAPRRRAGEPCDQLAGLLGSTSWWRWRPSEEWGKGRVPEPLIGLDLRFLQKM